jgi:pilus assembly protein CpaD
MTPRLPFLLIGLGALGACASIPDQPSDRAIPTAADRHEISVAQSAARLELPVAANDQALSPQARAGLRALAGQYLRAGYGPLVLSTPKGGGNENAAAVLSNETRRELAEAGVASAAIAASTFDASGRDDAPIVVSFSRYEARGPECAPLYEQDISPNSANQPWESFGCAMQANLAAMVENPRDLLTPRGEDARDSGRRNTVFGAYRSGVPTGAERSDDERVSVSDAVE